MRQKRPKRINENEKILIRRQLIFQEVKVKMLFSNLLFLVSFARKKKKKEKKRNSLHDCETTRVQTETRTRTSEQLIKPLCVR